MEELLSKAEINTQDGKIKIPDGTKHIKIDVGLSYNAPHSALWLKQESGLVVFGFEPHPDAIQAIKLGGKKMEECHGDPIDPSHIGKDFFIIPCALGEEEKTLSFYCTAKTTGCNLGCSSLYRPSNFPIEKIINVPCFRLDTFFSFFPFDKYPIIDYIKVDAQGSDLSIIKSGGKYITDHVVVITLEAETAAYIGTNNSVETMDNYMKSIGFIRLNQHFSGCYAEDPTYVNLRLIHNIPNVTYYQKG